MSDFVVEVNVKEKNGGKNGVFTPVIDKMNGSPEWVSSQLSQKYGSSSFAERLNNAFGKADEEASFLLFCYKNKRFIKSLIKEHNKNKGGSN